MESKERQSERKRTTSQALLARVAPVALGAALGAACASYAAWFATAGLWNVQNPNQASIVATWCFFAYTGSCVFWSWHWILNDEKVPVLITFYLAGCVLSVVGAFFGTYVGQVVGAVLGVLTAPFGNTWLETVRDASGSGCVIGAAVFVSLPWLYFPRDFEAPSPKPAGTAQKDLEGSTEEAFSGPEEGGTAVDSDFTRDDQMNAHAPERWQPQSESVSWPAQEWNGDDGREIDEVFAVELTTPLSSALREEACGATTSENGQPDHVVPSDPEPDQSTFEATR